MLYPVTLELNILVNIRHFWPSFSSIHEMQPYIDKNKIFIIKQFQMFLFNFL